MTDSPPIADDQILLQIYADWLYTTLYDVKHDEKGIYEQKTDSKRG